MLGGVPDRGAILLDTGTSVPIIVLLPMEGMEAGLLAVGDVPNILGVRVLAPDMGLVILDVEMGTLEPDSVAPLDTG